MKLSKTLQIKNLSCTVKWWPNNFQYTINFFLKKLLHWRCSGEILSSCVPGHATMHRHKITTIIWKTRFAHLCWFSWLEAYFTASTKLVYYLEQFSEQGINKIVIINPLLQQLWLFIGLSRTWLPAFFSCFRGILYVPQSFNIGMRNCGHSISASGCSPLSFRF